MPATGSDRRPWFRVRIRWTVRLRLTVVYSALFLLSGAALLAITYALVMHSGSPSVTQSGGVTLVQGDPGRTLNADPDTTINYLKAQAAREHAALLQGLLTKSCTALGLMSVASLLLGWVVAGRALRPVRTMADRARRISERNLHQRLAMAGPDDELKDLGDSFDALLARLDSAFEAQRRFVANASHELRTPLTLQRAVIEVALGDPEADAGTLRAVCERVLATGESQEQLIEALLTLASSQRGLDRRQPLALDELIAAVVAERRAVAAGRKVGLDCALTPARTVGDPRLVERLAANLVDNALRHNVPGGWALATSGTADGRPWLRVVNSGPVVPPDRVAALLQPFQRGDTRIGDEGHGLGLSIVAAVAAAHGARLSVAARPEGGLDVGVAFPA